MYDTINSYVRAYGYGQLPTLLRMLASEKIQISDVRNMLMFQAAELELALQPIAMELVIRE